MSIIATIDIVSEEIENRVINEVYVKKTEKKSFYKGGYNYGSGKEVVVRPYRMSDERDSLSPFKDFNSLF
jgi:hypothetical protein